MGNGKIPKPPIQDKQPDDSQVRVDIGSCAPTHPLLAQFIASYSYSVGTLQEKDAKLIIRAYPSVMTQLYFEFSGGISEVLDSQDKFAFGHAGDASKTSVKKRTYLKQGLGSWFDIYQLPTTLESRPIKNLKVDLLPNTLYYLFSISPQEVANEDLQLADLVGVSTSQRMLEEMEAASTGKALIDIVERYFLKHLFTVQSTQPLSLNGLPALPNLVDSLTENADRYNKGERWLQKHYSQVYGMSFKQMQNNLKFQKAIATLFKAIQLSRPINLTDLAFDCGYFDQAHFIKDFKRFTGMTPGQFLRANAQPDSQHLFYW